MFLIAIQYINMHIKTCLVFKMEFSINIAGNTFLRIVGLMTYEKTGKLYKSVTSYSGCCRCRPARR